MPVNLEQWDAADIIFFEAESPDGFLARFRNRDFAEEQWRRLWSAVATLLNRNLGQLGLWESHDLACIIAVIEQTGNKLAGRKVNSLDAFERDVLMAIEFLGDSFGEFST